MKRFIIIFFIQILFFSFSFEAKSQIALDKANKEANLTHYKEAVDLYHQAYHKKRTIEAARGLFFCYDNMKNYQKSQEWIDSVMTFDKRNFSDSVNYANSLKQQSKYEEAKAIYVMCKKVNNDKRLDYLINSCDSAIVWSKNKSRYIVSSQNELNTPQSEWGVVKYNNGVVFVSDRIVDSSFHPKKRFIYLDANNNYDKKSYGWTGLPYLKLFYAELDSNKFVSQELFNGYTPGEFHEGPAFFSKDGKQMYISRVGKVKKTNEYTENGKNTKDYKVEIELFYSDLDPVSNKWTEFKPFYLNNPLQYSITDPFLSKDGKRLYFSSNMKGGKGGVDLYYCDKTSDGKWAKPVNLSSVNTEADERFPFITDNGNLYFSSNTASGLGGWDIYCATPNKEGFNKAKNLEFPINSPYDDFSLMFFSESIGYFSSNREGFEKSDDIYKFQIKPEIYKVEGKIINNSNNTALDSSRVIIVNKKTNEKQVLLTGKDGSFTFNAKKDDQYSITAQKINFVTKQENINIKLELTKVEIRLNPIVVNKTIVMNNIYYDFDKYNINEKSARELDRLVEAMKLNPTVEIKIYSHTDEKGTARYNMKLSQKRAKSVIDYLVTHGIDSKRLQSEGKGETEPIVKCDRQSTNAECAQNRRTEFKITKY